MTDVAASGARPDDCERARVDVIDYRDKWEQAAPFENWVGRAEKNAELWCGLARRARVSDSAVAEASALGGSWKLLVQTEDWCGDGVNSLPFLARLAELSPNLELRVLGRDDHMDIMCAHRTRRPHDGSDPTGWSNSIPVVIILNENFEEHGWWGPRPAELQRWYWTEGQTFASKEERYKYVRTWYARDRGATTVAEVIGLVRTAAASGNGGRRGA